MSYASGTDGYAESVHGIPGFEVEGQPLVARTPLTESAALRIATEIYDLDPISAHRLETERDDSFAIDTMDERFVLKVAHPADEPEALDLQTQALHFAGDADASLPLQRILPTHDGDPTPALPAYEGRIARMFEWLPGTLLLDSPPNDPQLGLLGDALGRLTLSLAGFEHPVAEYPFAWDLAQFARLDRLLARFPNEEVAEVLRRFTRSVAPRLDELPRQVIHNDFNPGNVLVDATGPTFVTGILDFGDVIRTIRVADVAVGLCYQLYPLGRDWQSVQPFLDAYDRRVSLTSAEHAVLRDLVLCRFAQRVLINEWLSLDDDDRGRDEKFRAGVLAALGRLLEEN
jgi:hydroxylysine kinase